MLIAVCITVIVAVPLLAIGSSFVLNWSSSVVRNFDTPEEEQALVAAETVDYVSIVASLYSFERFNGPSDPEAYRQRGTHLSYTGANVIDSEVIDYYQNRYNYQQKQIIIRPRGATFSYNANITYLEQLHIFNSTKLEHGTEAIAYNGTTLQFTWNTTVIVFCDPDDYTPLTTVRPFEYMFYRNQTKYYTLSSTVNLSFSNCYLVEMELAYGENYSSLAGFSFHVRQIVVLDQNLVPVWIGIQPSRLVVA